MQYPLAVTVQWVTGLSQCKGFRVGPRVLTQQDWLWSSMPGTPRDGQKVGSIPRFSVSPFPKPQIPFSAFTSFFQSPEKLPVLKCDVNRSRGMTG